MRIGQKRRWQLVAMLLICLLALPASAVTVPGLYSVEVPVESSRPEHLARGYSDGLSRVFVRVSGSREVLALEGVQALLEDAESLLQSYQYLRSEDEGNRLRMAFGAVGVNRALASVNAPVWGANRPLVLAWIAVESQGSRSLILQAQALPDPNETGDQEQKTTVDEPGEPEKSEQPPLWRDLFRQAAEDRGLPLALPPESFAGRRELMSDVWGQFTNNVRAASEDLGHDLIALVRVSQSGDEWRAGWVFDGMQLEGAEQSLTATEPQELVAEVIGRWADIFAKRYAVDGSDVGTSPQVDIVIHGVDRFREYARASRALKNLSPVEDVSATGTDSEKVTFRLVFSGEMEQLKSYIALDPRLVPHSEAEISRLPTRPNTETAKVAEDPQGRIPTVNLSSSPFSAYESLLTDESEAEKAFESLYQVLHYRWQPATIISGESDE